MLACCNKSRAVCKTHTWASIPKRTADLDPAQIIKSEVAEGQSMKVSESFIAELSGRKNVTGLPAECKSAIQTVALNLVSDRFNHHGKRGFIKHLDPFMQYQFFDGLSQPFGVLLGHNDRASESLRSLH